MRTAFRDLRLSRLGSMRAGGGGGGGATAMSVGYDAAYDGGTTFDYIAAADAAGGGAGTLASPYTLAEALAAVGAGETIGLRGGTYRQTLTPTSGVDGSPITYRRYGNEVPVISGGEVLSSLTRCTSGRASVVGANWASVFEVTVATSAIASGDALAAFLNEADEPLQLACVGGDTTPYPIHLDAIDNWFVADSFTESGGDITGFVLPAAIDTAYGAQIADAQVYFHASPNLNYRTTVASYDGGTRTLVLADPTTKASDADKSKMCHLLNVPLAIKQGGWAWIDNGDSTTTLFVWPNDEANITSGITYTARETGIALTSHTVLDGLVVRQIASVRAAPTSGGYAMFVLGVGTKKNKIAISNCLVEKTFRGNRDYAPITMQNVDDGVVDLCTIQDAYGQFGIYQSSGSTDAETATYDWGMRGFIRRCKLLNIANSPLRRFGMRDSAAFHNLALGCGVSAHANKANDYNDGHNDIWFGNDLGGAGGYCTWQTSSAIHWIGNYMPVSNDGEDGRALVDQGFPTASDEYRSPAEALGLDGTSYILNNSAPPYYEAIAQIDSMTIGRANRALDYVVQNNIAHGLQTVTSDGDVTVGNNWLTSGSAGAGDVAEGYADVYTDADSGDVSIKSDAAIRAETGTDQSAVIADLKSRFSYVADADWSLDVDGNAIDWASPPIGAVVGYDRSLSFVVWIDRPQLLGTPVVGSVMSATVGTTYGLQTRSYQWQSRTGSTISDISGATSASYTLLVGDIGAQVRRKTTVGGVEALTAWSNAVASDYPLETPVLLALHQETSGTATSKNLETAPFTTSGKPITIVTSMRNGTSAEATLTVTIGADGRTFGTGTVVDFVSRSRRGSPETQILSILAPGSDTGQTVQVQSSLTSFGTQVAVFEGDGLTGFGTGVVSGATTVTTLSPGVTTTGTDSGVLYVICRPDGDTTANPITLTGCDTLSNANTGGTNGTTDLAVAIGYERAASPAAFSATGTWPTGKSPAGLAIEMLS